MSLLTQRPVTYSSLCIFTESSFSDSGERALFVCTFGVKWLIVDVDGMDSFESSCLQSGFEEIQGEVVSFIRIEALTM